MTGSGYSVDYLFPNNIDEASELAIKYGDRARFIAGGTDLWLQIEKLDNQIEKLIDLTRIGSLKTIEVHGNCIEIGSAVTYSQILDCAAICKTVPFLTDAMQTIGSVQIRNIATLVGNITNASPAGDSLAALYVLDSKVHIYGPQGSRTVPIDDFILGVRQVALDEGELVTHVSFEVSDLEWRGTFEKLGLRRAMAIAVVSIAALLIFEQDQVIEARLALGAVAPTIIRVPNAESFLVGRVLNDATIESTALMASEAAKPIDDVRASARYRKLAVQGLIRRALHKLQSNTET